MVLDFGPSWTKKTPTLQDAGSEGYWPDLEYKCDVTQEDLFSTLLNVNVYDENTVTANVLIGSASFSLRNLAGPSSFGGDVDIPINILGPKDKPSGRLILKAGLYPLEPKIELRVKDGFIRGIFHVNRILGHDLQGGGLLSELSSYVILKVPTPTPSNNTTINPSTLRIDPASNPKDTKNDPKALVEGPWSGQTPVRTGSNPLWDYLDLKPPVTFATVGSESVTVECWVKTLGGMGGDKMVGSGSVAMLSAGTGYQFYYYFNCSYIFAYFYLFIFSCIYLTHYSFINLSIGVFIYFLI